MVIYESPRRVSALLNEMHARWGDRRVVVARELTKKFETLLRGQITEVQAQLEGHALLGEVTLIVEGAAFQVRPQASHDPDDPTDPCRCR